MFNKLSLFFLFCFLSYSFTAQAEVRLDVKKCFSELKSECPHFKDFEGAIFRCSWRVEKTIPKKCNVLFSKTFQYLFLKDRPHMQHICTPANKQICNGYREKYEAYQLTFRSYLTKHFKMTINEYILLAGQYENK